MVFGKLLLTVTDKGKDLNQKILSKTTKYAREQANTCTISTKQNYIA